MWPSQLYNIDFKVGGRGTVCLSHVLLGDYFIHNFNDEIHMGRNVKYVYIATGWKKICLSCSDYICSMRWEGIRRYALITTTKIINISLLLPI